MHSSHQPFLTYVLQNSQSGDIRSVINTIDKYGWTKQWLMNIGDVKGEILDKAIRTRQPKTVLELGTFLGYSSLRMAAQVPADTVIISLDKNPDTTEVARTIHKHAGAGDRIHTAVGETDKLIPHLSDHYRVTSFDFIFIDHYGSNYLRDLKLLEQCGLIQSGTMIVADNVIAPGAPDYLQYVRNNSNYKTSTHESVVEYDQSMVDGVEISVRN